MSSIPRPSQPRQDSRRASLAEVLWGKAIPASGSPVEDYLRTRGCYVPTPSIRCLPPNRKHGLAMVAKFQGTSAIHLTRLRPDGLGKAGTDHDKLMIGPVSGFPVVIRSSEWSKPLLITEGVEDALSLSLAFPEWTVWAAGSAGMIPKLVGVADRAVVLVVDADLAGEKAIDRSFDINGGITAIKCKKGLDPNAILVQHGLNALRAMVTRHQPFHR